MSESEHVQTMQVLDLLLDVAYHDGTPRDLAVAAEAYTLAGFHDGAIMVSHASHDETMRRVADARRGRPRQLLRHDAQGLLYGVRQLIREGVVDGTGAWRRKNARWQERGGYDGPVSSADTAKPRSPRSDIVQALLDARACLVVKRGLDYALAKINEALDMLASEPCAPSPARDRTDGTSPTPTAPPNGHE